MQHGAGSFENSLPWYTVGLNGLAEARFGVGRKWVSVLHLIPVKPSGQHLNVRRVRSSFQSKFNPGIARICEALFMKKAFGVETIRLAIVKLAGGKRPPVQLQSSNEP